MLLEESPATTVTQPHAIWPRIWLIAVTRPAVSTYQAIARQPTASIRHAYIWMCSSSLIAALIPFLAHLVQEKQVDTGLLLVGPIPATITVLAWMIFTSCAHWIVRLFKGVSTYSSLAYAFAAFSAPLTIVANLLALIPGSGLLLAGQYIYWLVLYALAIRAVSRFSRKRAVGVLLISLLFTCSLFGLVSLLVFWRLIASA
jgi:hypothetical protein